MSAPVLAAMQPAPTRGRGRPPKHPCGQCRGACGKGTFHCEYCSTWYHAECESLTQQELHRLSLDTNYACRKCVAAGACQYNYDIAQRTLQSAAAAGGFHKLKSTVDKHPLFQAVPPLEISSQEMFIFDERVGSVKDLVASLTPEAARFNEYFCGARGLVGCLRTGVVEPNINHGIGFDWTNNNSESANHVLKCASQWKPLPLPKLVDKLHEVVRMQQIDVERALYGQGNYKLAPITAHYGVASRDWAVMGADQRKKKLWQFIRDTRPAKRSNLVRSTGGKLKVRTTPSSSKKSGQGKRKRTERSRSAKKLRLGSSAT
jgi:hypothetical protein